MEFQNSYQKLGASFSAPVQIAPLKNPQWLIHSPEAFSKIDVDKIQPADWLDWFNGKTHKTGEQHISHVYAGHQFGVWAGQLGDGRALSLGELINHKNERWEIQLKGSGPTPFSRFGDGKAVVRSSIREFLASEALCHLGIPTTRALAVLRGEGDVQRETLEKEAFCVRLIPSNVRFGTFEWFASQGDKESLQKLVNYCFEVLFPGVERTLPSLLTEITLRTARLVAEWQAVGFCHGVMNTDNMSVLGVTLDYGPYGFLETTDLNYICNHSDYQGRYRYSNQPGVALWNLHRLAAVFSFMDDQADFDSTLKKFIPAFEEAYFHRMCGKLGMNVAEDENQSLLVPELLHLMQDNRLDFTETFRKFSSEAWKDLPILEWLRKYEKHRVRPGEKNPVYVLKNYVAERAIRAVEDKDDLSVLHQIFDVLKSPYQERGGLEWWSGPSPEPERCLSVSCSS